MFRVPREDGKWLDIVRLNRGLDLLQVMVLCDCTPLSVESSCAFGKLFCYLEYRLSFFSFFSFFFSGDLTWLRWNGLSEFD